MASTALDQQHKVFEFERLIEKLNFSRAFIGHISKTYVSSFCYVIGTFVKKYSKHFF